ncbi:MAG: fumarate hydratase [Candidatus Margulisbacteria bacterium]|nr:fumarate hydratase [Candidatus Margulisiibacteriota bacterium]
MREVPAKEITETVKDLCIEANTNLAEDVVAALNKSLAKEKSSVGRKILRQIIQNAQIARRDKLPLCQDTGLAVVFIELGQEVQIIGEALESAVHEGVRQGYEAGFLRKSVTEDPILRKNTGDNTPAILHVEIVPGAKIKIGFLAKGGGAENCSALRIFNPSTDREEIDNFILETVEAAGPNACPPIIVGVGIGGNFDTAAYLAKKALCRKVGAHNSGHAAQQWEKELLKKINLLGIGPMGLGGTTTALAVNIEKRPCHISSLPAAVNIDCHAHRFKETII